MTSSTPSWMYFLAGSLLPTLAWLFLARSNRNTALLMKDHPLALHEEDDDDQVVSKSTSISSNSRPSRQWGIRDAPYKVLEIMSC
jgi:hypothetical protein